jgi:radical SAM superfamily enzyme YgiQ (UPF0313 family)
MILLLSTYDLGRQPFGLASAAAALAAHGVDVACLDLARQRLDADLVARSEAVAFFLPMHTATRLALPVMDRVRAINPAARLLAFGLYAPLNERLLRARGVTDVLGGEFEDGLVRAVRNELAGAPGSGAAGDPASGGTGAAPVRLKVEVPRVQFRQPVRDGLPPLTRYASVQLGGGRRIAGYTEASRGCKHRCRHCPIVPVYDGRFRIVPIPVVLADVRAQVAAGAQHITFGDPDFFNGIRHARELLRALAAEWPGLSYDVTIKVEHLLKHAEDVPLLAETGCLFVTTAVESVDDRVLRALEKGHTGADFAAVAALCRAAGVTLAPTFVPFTPWTTLPGYCELLQTIDRLDLVEHVAPIQLAIRLLIPEGSRLLELAEIRGLVGEHSPASLTYPWAHLDPEVDALQRRVERLVGLRLSSDRRAVFDRIWREAHAAAGISEPARHEPLPSRATIPYLNEPWYC